jgi:transposase-like protein
VLNKVRKPDQAALKAGLHRIMNAPTRPAAWSAAHRFADRWQDLYPKAVACLRAGLDDLLTCFRYRTLEERKAVRTTDEIERCTRSPSAGSRPSACCPAPRPPPCCSGHSSPRVRSPAPGRRLADPRALTLTHLDLAA